MDLSISIPSRNHSSYDRHRGDKTQSNQNSIQLEDCLRAFIQEEDMEKCGFKCTKCKSEDLFKKQMTVWRYPKILVIHLKRFLITNHGWRKLRTRVTVPLRLDMRPYAPYSSNLNTFLTKALQRILLQRVHRTTSCTESFITRVLSMEVTMYRKFVIQSYQIYQAGANF